MRAGARDERRNAAKWSNLFLLRHGESTCNEVNRFAGTVDAPLTSLGEAQAVRAASQWRGMPPDLIYVSPLARARRTAELLCARVDDTETATPILRVVDRLRERHFGDFTLRNKAFLQRDVGLRSYEQVLYGNSESLPDGESFGNFYGRILSFLRDEIHPLLLQGKGVLVVSHKYVIELLSRLVLRMKAEAAMTFDSRTLGC
ncbi:MAG: phosphoglycerate mutase family protein [Gammaproteobacteria bacterium]|nr:phosphoglycerate mutase family protein [Gammaproteobacteria bacterium]MDJ0872712.1 phosphoglycerate mutase family protein [Gammaproteobacteria bacterium]